RAARAPAGPQRRAQSEWTASWGEDGPRVRPAQFTGRAPQSTAAQHLAGVPVVRIAAALEHLVDGARTAVVRGERELLVSAVLLHQLVQVPEAEPEIGLPVEQLLAGGSRHDATGGPRHDLGQAP